MAKITGLGWTSINVDGSDTSADDITNDVTNAELSLTRAMQDVTGVDKSAIERLSLLADCQVTLNGVFNPALSHLTFRDFASTNVQRTTALVHSSQTLSIEALISAYDVSRAATGELTWSVPLLLANGTAPAWTS